jgi:hypothetical protein
MAMLLLQTNDLNFACLEFLQLLNRLWLRRKQVMVGLWITCH